jgi:hypothetical protein
VLRYKVKSVANKVLDVTSEEVDKPTLHHNDLAVLEDDLKPECDALNSLVKAINAWKTQVDVSSKEKHVLDEAARTLRVKLDGKPN